MHKILLSAAVVLAFCAFGAYKAAAQTKEEKKDTAVVL